jgi:hypothetical protein
MTDDIDPEKEPLLDGQTVFKGPRNICQLLFADD